MESKLRWQTKAMEEQIDRLKPSISEIEDLDPVDLENVHDITGTQDANKLIHKFFPDVKITGFALFAERLKSWGGLYYRILQNRNTKSDEPNERCIQWLYVWTKQKFFFSFWETIIPPFILCLLSLLYHNNFDFVELNTFWDSLLHGNFLTAIGSMFYIGLYFVLLGLYRIGYALKQRSKGKVYFHNSMLLFPIGGIFLYFIYQNSIWQSITLGNAPWHIIMKVLFIWRPNLIKNVALLIPTGAIILFGLTILLGFIWIIQELKMFKMHDMDWAPLFIYLKQNDSQEWDFDKVIYDSYHYFTEIKTNTDISERAPVNALFTSEISRLKFEIPNFWHSFDLFNEKRRRSVIVVASAISFFSFIVSLLLRIFNTSAAFSLLSLVLWLVGVFVIYARRSSYLIPYEKKGNEIIVRLRSKSDQMTEFDEIPRPKLSGRLVGLIRGKPINLSLSNSIFHLSPNRLNQFWQLKGDAVFQIRSKLKNPFVKDFVTFRDES